MNQDELIRMFSSIIYQASPLMIAVCGETINERAGVINLSADGTMLMSAMTGFVVALKTNNLLLGFLAAALVGMLFAWIIAFGSIRLKQNQVAVGFVLTLLGADLSAFLGQNFTRLPGPVVKHLPIPVLKDIPILGKIFFDHDLVVYFAISLVFFTAWFFSKTRPGLILRSVGERPETAFARGVNVNATRYLYTMVGGSLMGVAGAAYSLNVKIGWSDGHTQGFGWIALAIVIFGGWSPIRGMLGAILFGATKSLAQVLQRTFPQVSLVAFNSIPWMLMIAVLVISGSNFSERLVTFMPSSLQKPLRRIMRVNPPLALGTLFTED